MLMHVLWFFWIIRVCLMSITLLPLAEAQTDVLEVQLGASVILGCEISYHSETTWLKQRLDGPPLILIQSFLDERGVSHRHRPDPRLHTQIKGQSLALNISFLEESDLGLYYCMGMENKILKVGRGKRLKVNESLFSGLPLVTSGVQSQMEDVPGTEGLAFYHLYVPLVGVGVVGMVLAVVITHLRTKSM